MADDSAQKTAKTAGGTRLRAAPKRSLSPRRVEPIDRFLHRVGYAIYGVDWNEGEIRKKNISSDFNPIIVSDISLAQDVAEQIRENLLTGAIEAFVRLVVRLKDDVSVFDDDSDIESSVTTNPLSIDLSGYLDQNEPSARQPTEKVFAVSKPFWARELKFLGVDWATGAVDIKFDHLIEDDPDYPDTRLSVEKYDVVSGGLPLIYIKNSDQSLRKMFSYQELPNKDWFSRYIVYRSKGRIEALAAGWRHLALMDAKENMNPTKLARLMEEYLQAQGFRKSENGQVNTTLRAMAVNMLDQLKTANRNSSVLVSSDNHNPK